MDSLCLKAGIHGMAPPNVVTGNGGVGGCLDVRTSHVAQLRATAVGRSSTAAGTSMSVEKPLSPKKKNSAWGFSFRYPLRSLWPGGKNNRYDAMAADDAVLIDEKKDEEILGEEEEEEEEEESEGQNGNWVLKILHVKSLWKEENKKNGNGNENGVTVKLESDEEDGGVNGNECDEECEGCRVEDNDDDDDEKIKFDRESFSKLLKRVTLAEARLYAQMSYLGNLAYAIPQIKPKNLLRYHGLRFVTSSVEKKEQALKAEKEKALAEGPQPEKEKASAEALETEGDRIGKAAKKEEKTNGEKINASAAYEIAASAASYLHSHTKSILAFRSSKSTLDEDLPERTSGSSDNANTMHEEVASFMATTDSVTAVVAAKEEVKQAVADDLNSTHSSPCGWFICDDDQSATRYFVIQGSESLASWQANLLFEPIKFEGLDVLVHRGIYEAAKGIYEQMLPEVRAHLKFHGARASFRFTGHSLGGSLSLLVNLMLLIRGEVPASSLLPVITFGAPAIMCGGDHLLHQLGLPRSHVQAITMHRDIVPRAFSCHYPNHVAEFLKAVNGNFRNHPCLNNQKLLFAPTGEFLILQPDDKFSPHHHLLPSGSGLYLLRYPAPDGNEADKQIRAAQTVFLNSPHPLEILSDRAAYGTGGNIQRDHDMNSYLKSIRNVIRQELNSIRKARRQHRRKVWWPLVAPRGVNASIIVGRPVASGNMSQGQFNFSGILQNGKESFKRFSRLVASQHMHLLVVLLFPARVLILGTYSIINFP